MRHKRRMKEWGIPLVAVIFLIVLFAISVPFLANRIEADLEKQLYQSLQSQEMHWVEVQLNGRDVQLSGTATTAQQREAALSLVRRIAGVRNINDQMNVTVKRISPYTFTAEYQKNSLSLSGYLPDEAYHTQLLEQMQATFAQQKIQDHLQLASGSPDQWKKILPPLLAELSKFEHGRLEISDYDIRLTGLVAKTETLEHIKQAMQALLSYNYHPHLYLKAADEKALLCQQKINALMSNNKVRFASGSAIIERDSYALLERLIAVAGSCPDAHITIAGHTDAQGDNNTNLRLSQERAQSVLDYLAQNGLKTSKLKAVGYGESKLLDNHDNETAHAKNRRIEFIIKGY